MFYSGDLAACPVAYIEHLLGRKFALNVGREQTEHRLKKRKIFGNNGQSDILRLQSLNQFVCLVKGKKVTTHYIQIRLQ